MATGTVTVSPVARTGRAKSPAFQRSIEALRNGRSYQQFANDIKARTGIEFSRSLLKRVEAGTRAPNPLMLYALEVMSGREPSALLGEYAEDAGGRDLLRHGRTGQSNSHQIGGADVPAEARIRELQDRVDQLERLVPEIESVLVKLANIAGDSIVVRPVRATESRSRRRSKKTA